MSLLIFHSIDCITTDFINFSFNLLYYNGLLEISASTSWHQHRHCKRFFCLTKCYMKNRAFIWNILQYYTETFFLALSYAASVSFCHNYSFFGGFLPYLYQNTQENIYGGVFFENICRPSRDFKLCRAANL